MRPFKNRFWVLLLLLLSFSLVGCSGFSFSFSWPNGETTTTTTFPTSFSGSISLQDSDYDQFLTYSNPNFQSLTLEQYNTLLIQTRDHIRRTNIKIVTTQYRYVSLFPGSRTTIEQIMGSSAGSGVVYKQDDQFYYAITNFHVIDSKDYLVRYEVSTFASEITSTGEVIAFSESLDLAVIRFAKADRTNVELINLQTRAFTKFNPGELVLAAGNPLSIDYNVTFGHFIRLERIQNVPFRVIYHNAMIHQGSSGGALVDIEGNLIGINTWGSSSSDEQSFAIPHYIVYEFLINNELL